MDQASEFALGIAAHAIDEFEPVLLISGGIGREEDGEPTRRQREKGEEGGSPGGARAGEEARHEAGETKVA